MTDLQLTTQQQVYDFVDQAWQDLFKVEAIQANDGFFDLGGTSLAAVKFITTVESVFGTDALTPEDLYENQQFEFIVATILKNVSH